VSIFSSKKSADNTSLQMLKKSRYGRAWFWFLLPSLLLVIVFFFLPVLITIFLSGTNMSSATGFSGWDWVGFKNYITIIKHPDTPKNFLNTLKYVGITLIFFNVGMGLVIALITTHIPKKPGFFFRAIWLLPRLTPPVIYVMMWNIIAADAPYGIISQMILVPLGLPTTNLVPEAAFLFIVLVNGYVGASFGMILFTSAIESISKDIMVSCLVDGASIMQRIRYIILPQIRWPLLFVTTYQTLSLLTSFNYILIMTDGNFGTEVWALWSYHRALNNYYGNFQYAFGSALATLLVIIGIIMAVIYLRYFKFDELVQEPKIDQL